MIKSVSNNKKKLFALYEKRKQLIAEECRAHTHDEEAEKVTSSENSSKCGRA